MIPLTNKQARRFLLLRHSLMGPGRYAGKQGALDYVRSVGSIQFDPVDVCGRNPEIILQSRVKGFDKRMLDELLYQDRRLIDFFDKNLCIFPVEDWPYLGLNPGSGGYAEAYDRRVADAMGDLKPLILRLIKERGSVSAGEIEVDERIVWHWGSRTSLPRAALESMYFRGELVIHHKKGAIKSYALAGDYIPPHLYKAPDPFRNEAERARWLAARRISAVGMLWNRGSVAWLGAKINAPERAAAFSALLESGEIFAVRVENIREPLYIREQERPLLEKVLSGYAPRGRAEFLAPLDCLLWDRRLIEAVFSFAYKWEIYTPADQRRYGPYTLPFLWGDGFAGRADFERRNEKLIVKRFYPEKGISFTGRLKRDFEACAERFAVFNGCAEVEYL